MKPINATKILIALSREYGVRKIATAARETYNRSDDNKEKSK